MSSSASIAVYIRVGPGKFLDLQNFCDYHEEAAVYGNNLGADLAVGRAAAARWPTTNAQSLQCKLLSQTLRRT